MCLNDCTVADSHETKELVGGGLFVKLLFITAVKFACMSSIAFI